LFGYYGIPVPLSPKNTFDYHPRASTTLLHGKDP